MQVAKITNLRLVKSHLEGYCFFKENQGKESIGYHYKSSFYVSSSDFFEKP